MQVATHEDYLAAVATAVCEQYPTATAALSEVELVFGAARQVGLVNPRGAGMRGR